MLWNILPRIERLWANCYFFIVIFEIVFAVCDYFLSLFITHLELVLLKHHSI